MAAKTSTFLSSFAVELPEVTGFTHIASEQGNVLHSSSSHVACAHRPYSDALPSKSLMHLKLGGPELVRAGSGLFQDYVLKDLVLEPFFDKVDCLRMVLKMDMLLNYAYGLSNTYTAKDLVMSHARMIQQNGLNTSHFDLLLEHFVAALSQAGIAEDVVQEGVVGLQKVRPLFDPSRYEDGVDLDQLLLLEAQELDARRKDFDRASHYTTASIMSGSNLLSAYSTERGSAGRTFHCRTERISNIVQGHATDRGSQALSAYAGTERLSHSSPHEHLSIRSSQPSNSTWDLHTVNAMFSGDRPSQMLSDRLFQVADGRSSQPYASDATEQTFTNLDTDYTPSLSPPSPLLKYNMQGGIYESSTTKAAQEPPSASPYSSGRKSGQTEHITDRIRRANLEPYNYAGRMLDKISAVDPPGQLEPEKAGKVSMCGCIVQ